jgi:hypothetical protein
MQLQAASGHVVLAEFSGQQQHAAAVTQVLQKPHQLS